MVVFEANLRLMCVFDPVRFALPMNGLGSYLIVSSFLALASSPTLVVVYRFQSNKTPPQQGSYNTNAAQALATRNTLQPHDKMADDLLSSSQTTAQLLEFDIPLNVSKASGLGVSVKGKTAQLPSQQTQPAQKDLGIFIKDIIAGGAAQLVGGRHAAGGSS